MADLSSIAPYLEGAFLGETMQDWVQTTRFLRDPHFQEANPILGKHPSQAKMSAFGVGMDAAQYAGYEALPDNYKLPYAAISAILEGANVARNKKVTGYPLDKPSLALGALLTAAVVAIDKSKALANQKKYNIGVSVQPKGAMATFNMKW
jgi:hypothetical protein